MKSGGIFLRQCQELPCPPPREKNRRALGANVGDKKLVLSRPGNKDRWLNKWWLNNSTCQYLPIPIPTNTNQYLPVPTSTHCQYLVPTSTYQYLLPASTYQHLPVPIPTSTQNEHSDCQFSDLFLSVFLNPHLVLLALSLFPGQDNRKLLSKNIFC